MRDYFKKNDPIRFVFPIDGDCLNRNDGQTVGEDLLIPVSVEAPAGHEVRICGASAVYSDGLYRARIPVRGRESVLSAEDLTAGKTCDIKVFRLRNPMGGYRVSSDDNLLFLADIHENRDRYRSIFENPYLAVYKEAHDKYGAKVHLNLFYEFDEESRSHFSSDRKYFNLSMMTDKFREEFRANAHWLRLSFHAKSEFPMEPYKHADGETVTRDALQILREIVRFAGPETLSACTTVHFGEANEDGVTALRKLGYKAMTGYFWPQGPKVAYYAPQELIEHIYPRDFWKDTETDVLFGRIDSVLNCNTHEKNMEDIKEAVASPGRGGFISIMIHEQYFYEDYDHHRPDFARRVLEPCEFLARCGYTGRFISEVDDLGLLPELP